MQALVVLACRMIVYYISTPLYVCRINNHYGFSEMLDDHSIHTAHIHHHSPMKAALYIWASCLRLKMSGLTAMDLFNNVKKSTGLWH